jgi:4-amino-4-deoxy-L-arabinose transferase-like glycosyltransferase
VNKLLALGILVLASFLLSINISKPFIGQHDWNGVVYGQQAKNFYRYGFIPLKFGATMATPDVPAESRIFQIHYSPALPMLISFSYRSFGVSERSTRLVPVVASLASVLLVMLLGRESISFRAGIMAGILMAVTPMFIYYGKNPVHEVVLLPLALLSFYSYQRFLKTNRDKWWKILLLSLIGAMLTGWSGYYATGLIFTHGILLRRNEKIRFLQLPLTAATLLVIFFFHSKILNPQATGDLQNIFLARLGGASVGLMDFLIKEFRYSINLFTITLLLLSMIWVFSTIPGILRKSLLFLRKQESTVIPAKAGIYSDIDSESMSGMTRSVILLLLGIFGIAHVLIFRQAGYYHEYLLFPLLPFVALASAGTVENLLKIFQGLKIKILIAGFILFLTAKERLGYLQALLKSEYVKDIYEEAVEYGKIVKRNPDIIVPIERDIYFIFYADTVIKK